VAEAGQNSAKAHYKRNGSKLGFTKKQPAFWGDFKNATSNQQPIQTN